MTLILSIIVIAACSSVEPLEINLADDTIALEQNTEQVVEGLVSSAGNSGDRDIENILLDTMHLGPVTEPSIV